MDVQCPFEERQISPVQHNTSPEFLIPTQNNVFSFSQPLRPLKFNFEKMSIAKRRVCNFKKLSCNYLQIIFKILVVVWEKLVDMGGGSFIDV